MVRPEWVLTHPKNITVFERDQLAPIRISHLLWLMMVLGTPFGAYGYLRASKSLSKDIKDLYKNFHEKYRQVEPQGN